MSEAKAARVRMLLGEADEALREAAALLARGESGSYAEWLGDLLRPVAVEVMIARQKFPEDGRAAWRGQ